MLIRIKIIEKIPSPPPNGSHGVERDPGAPTCLRMVAKHYGRSLSAQELREAAEIGKDGVNLLGIAQAAEKVGFKTLGVKVNLEKLIKDSPLPCIVHWGQNHFVVLAPNP